MYMSVYICMFIYVCVRVCVCVCAPAYVVLLLLVVIGLHLRACVCVCVCVCVCLICAGWLNSNAVQSSSGTLEGGWQTAALALLTAVGFYLGILERLWHCV